MCLTFESIVPPTEKGKKMVDYLKVLAVAELVIAILYMSVMGDFYDGFFELIVILLLFLAWSQINYCVVMMYSLYCIYQSLKILIFFLTNLQNYRSLFQPNQSKINEVAEGMYLIFLLFYPIASYFGFLAYREFKGINYDAISGQYQQQDNNQYRYSPPSQQQPQSNPYAWPASNQQAQPFRNEPAQTNQSQGFAAFQGRGVTIG